MMIQTSPGNNPRDYQIVGIKHLLSGKHKLLADDMGLGKTIMAAVAISTLNPNKTLILCPSAVLYSWEREIQKWSIRYPWVQIMEGMMCKVADWATVVICPYSILHSPFIAHQLKETRWGVCVIDEVHYLKSTSANRTHVVFGKRNGKGIVHNSVYIWALSGTPMTNAPVDTWPLMRKLNGRNLGKYKTYEKFTRRFCGRYVDRMGRVNVKGAKNIPELKSLMFDTGFGLRREKREVLKELPPKELRILPMKSPDEKLCEPVDWDAKIKESSIEGGLTCEGDEIAEARKAVGLAKIPHVLKHLENIEGKIVLFCWHQDVVKEYHKRIPNSVIYNGACSARKKDEALIQFIQGGSEVFIANYLSAGTGLDGLQKVCAYACFAEIPWTYTEVMQAADRLDRYGQRQTPLIDIIVCRKTIDQYMMKKIFNKEKIHKSLLTDETT